ncbi:MAG: replicative DNA helicase [Rhodothermales bacterium]
MSSDAQIAILSQMIKRREVYYASGLRVEHFIPGPARRLFQTIAKLYTDSKEVDSFMLRGELDAETFAWYAKRVRDAVPSAANWKYYRDAVVDDHRRRRIGEIIAEAQTRIDDASIGDWIMHEIARAEDTGGAALVDQSEFIDEYVGAVQERHRSAGKTPGIPTGIPRLDGFTHGLQKRRLIVIGARPSFGKTALMTTLAANIARQGLGAGIVSLESSRYELTERIVSNIANLDNEDLATGKINPGEFDRLREAQTLMKSKAWNVRISDNPYLSIEGVRARVREMVVAYGVDIVFLDYVQRIRPRNDEIPFRLHIAECSGELKSLAEDLEVPVVALAQLGRDADGHRPRLSHFKESGQIEQDADIAILIGQTEDGTILDVAKNRDGRRGVVPVRFTGPYMRFSERSDE